jgi:hypothetical protein
LHVPVSVGQGVVYLRPLASDRGYLRIEHANPTPLEPIPRVSEPGDHLGCVRYGPVDADSGKTHIHKKCQTNKITTYEFGMRLHTLYRRMSESDKVTASCQRAACLPLCHEDGLKGMVGTASGVMWVNGKYD